MLPALFVFTSIAALAPVGDDVQRGVALGLFATDARFDYGPLLDEIAASGATDVQLDVVWMQRDVHSARIHRQPGSTPDDDTVLRTIHEAKARGLRVELFPIVRLEQHTKDEWRGKIDPAAGVDAWFASYRDFLVAMAALAQSGGAERMSIGSELLSLEKYDARWRALVDDVRARFHGKLVYSANWDHFDAVPFWDVVDEAGVTGYFELAPDDDTFPSDAALDAAWGAPRAALVALKERAKKPLVVTEIGYPAVKGAAHHPWDETAGGVVDERGQERLLAAFCRAFSQAKLVDGFYVWNWFPGAYSPRGRPAQKALEQCNRSWPKTGERGAAR